MTPEKTSITYFYCFQMTVFIYMYVNTKVQLDTKIKKDLDTIVSWSKKCQIHLNVKNCSFLCGTRKILSSPARITC